MQNIVGVFECLKSRAYRNVRGGGALSAGLKRTGGGHLRPGTHDLTCNKAQLHGRRRIRRPWVVSHLMRRQLHSKYGTPCVLIHQHFPVHTLTVPDASRNAARLQ